MGQFLHLLPLSSSFSILPSWFPGSTPVNVIETSENRTLSYLRAERLYNVSEAVAFSCSLTLICSKCLSKQCWLLWYFHILGSHAHDSSLTNTLIPFMHTENIQRAFFVCVCVCCSFTKDLHEDKLCWHCVRNTCWSWGYQDLCFRTIGKRIDRSTHCRTRPGKSHLVRR